MRGTLVATTETRHYGLEMEGPRQRRERATLERGANRIEAVILIGLSAILILIGLRIFG